MDSFIVCQIVCSEETRPLVAQENIQGNLPQFQWIKVKGAQILKENLTWDQHTWEQKTYELKLRSQKYKIRKPGTEK